ncbi:hypothetical protein [Enterococcus phage vB_Efm10_KEN22]
MSQNQCQLLSSTSDKTVTLILSLVFTTRILLYQRL